MFPSLLIRAPKVTGLCVFPYLSGEELAALHRMGLKWIIRMPHVWVNHDLLTTLAKRWHSEHNTFHLPTGEASITLEDVYHILQVPCHGELVSVLISCFVVFMQILIRKRLT